MALSRFVLLRYLWIAFLAALAPGCTRFQILNATVPSCTYRQTSDLSYGPTSRQKLDVYQPRKSIPGPARVVIFFYGGYWQAGQKSDYRFVAEALAAEGFIAVLPDYRLYPETTFPGFVEDGALAVRWVHDHIEQYGGDPRLIYLMGHSAGAHIATLLTLDHRYLEAVGLDAGAIRATASLSCPYDFIPDNTDRAVFKLKPGDPPNPAIEPIRFANSHSAPLLLVHGCLDDIVRPSNAQQMADAMRGAGRTTPCAFYRNLGHVGIALSLASSFHWLAPVLHDTSVFFRAH